MKKMIDIFGDGECIFDRDNLPDEIIASSGKWKKQETGKPNYKLVERSQWYIDNVIEPGKARSIKRQKEMEKENKITRKMREIAIRELEKEKSGT